GDLVILQHTLQNRAVGFHISGDQRKIPVMIPFFPYQGTDLRSRPGSFLLRIFQHMKADLLLFSFRRCSVFPVSSLSCCPAAAPPWLLPQAEQVLVQRRKGASCPKPAFF